MIEKTEGLICDSIPDLKIEQRCDGMISLEQSIGCGDTMYVDVHPIHVRLMAEKFGLIRSSDPLASKTIAMLTRRLCTLRDRAAHIASYIAFHPSEYDEQTYQTEYLAGTAEIASEFCQDLDGATDLPDWTYCGPDSDQDKSQKAVLVADPVQPCLTLNTD